VGVRVGRRTQAWLLALLTALAVTASNVVAISINTATNVQGPWPWGLDLVRRHPFRWSGVLTLLMIIVAVGIWWLSERTARKLYALVPGAERPASWVVDRPAEIEAVVTALRAGHRVGITTGLHGAGGFGKTTLAKVVRADARILATFGTRVYWVTLGRDLSQEAVADRLNAVVTWVSGQPVLRCAGLAVVSAASSHEREAVDTVGAATAVLR
jgi:hypothetical protein